MSHRKIRNIPKTKNKPTVKHCLREIMIKPYNWFGRSQKKMAAMMALLYTIGLMWPQFWYAPLAATFVMYAAVYGLYDDFVINALKGIFMATCGTIILWFPYLYIRTI